MDHALPVLPEGFRLVERRSDGWSGCSIILALEIVDPLRHGQWSELDTRTFEARSPSRDAEIRRLLVAQLERAAREFVAGHSRYTEQLRTLPWRADRDLPDLAAAIPPAAAGIPDRWSRITRALQA